MVGQDSRWVWLLTLPLLVSPLAMAGSAQDPELSDPPGDASPPGTNEFADITAGWVNETQDAIVVNLELASFPQAPPQGEVYTLQFQQDPSTCLAYYGAVIYNGTETLQSTGTFDLCTNQVLTQQPANGQVPTSQTPRMTIEIPRTLLNTSYQGAKLLNFSATTYNWAPFFGCLGQTPACPQFVDLAFHDVAQENSTYTLQQGPEPPQAASTGTGQEEAPENGTNETSLNASTDPGAPGARTNESPPVGLVGFLATVSLAAGTRLAAQR